VVYAMFMCLSLCPSVTSGSYIKTAENSITQTNAINT